MQEEQEKPLRGRRVVVTRAPAQAADLVERLQALGAEPVLLPTIELVPLDSPEISQALLQLHIYHWIIFTSSNTVRFFFEKLSALGKGPLVLASKKIAAVGQGTAAALGEHGVKADICPTEANAEGLLAELPETFQGETILLPRAQKAREILPETLRARGARVDVIALYKNVPPSSRTLPPKDVDAFTFASPSAVENFLRLFPEGEGRERLTSARVIAIGPVTAKLLSERGIQNVLVARQASVDGLLEALLCAFGAQ